MFCTNCGNKIKEGEKFCTGCGNSISFKLEENNNHQIKITRDEKWWHRLMRVLYIVSYLPLILLVMVVWEENEPYCSYYYSSNCYGSYWESFFYSLVSIIIYIVILRLIKIAIIYITSGEKPKWKKEFKKFY